MKATKAEEVENKQNDDIKLTENALKVLEKRYLKKDKTGKPTEQPEQLFRRVARLLPRRSYCMIRKRILRAGKTSFTARWSI